MCQYPFTGTPASSARSQVHEGCALPRLKLAKPLPAKPVQGHFLGHQYHHPGASGQKSHHPEGPTTTKGKSHHHLVKVWIVWLQGGNSDGWSFCCNLSKTRHTNNAVGLQAIVKHRASQHRECPLLSLLGWFSSYLLLCSTQVPLNPPNVQCKIIQPE